MEPIKHWRSWRRCFFKMSLVKPDKLPNPLVNDGLAMAVVPDGMEAFGKDAVWWRAVSKV